MKDKIKILFLCTGNSCRSQTSEGWARHLKSDVIDAYSAGINPIAVSSRAGEMMAEAGVDISNHVSKHVDDLASIDFDYVVTVCDNAKEHCPVFSDRCKMAHKSFPDPTMFIGTAEQIMGAFRKCRDDMKVFIETMPESLKAKGQTNDA